MACRVPRAVWLAFPFLAAGRPECWVGALTEALCCDPLYGGSGNAVCWDGPFNHAYCCLPARQHFPAPPLLSKPMPQPQTQARAPPQQAAMLEYGIPECWMEGTMEPVHCCHEKWGPGGNPPCWDSYFTNALCCNTTPPAPAAALGPLGSVPARDRDRDGPSRQLQPPPPRPASETPRVKAVEAGSAQTRCERDYVTSRDLFRSASGMPRMPLHRHDGNPDLCLEHGHSFQWVAFTMESSKMSELVAAGSMGVCLPRSCDYNSVTDLLMGELTFAGELAWFPGLGIELMLREFTPLSSCVWRAVTEGSAAWLLLAFVPAALGAFGPLRRARAAAAGGRQEPVAKAGGGRNSDLDCLRAACTVAVVVWHASSPRVFTLTPRQQDAFSILISPLQLANSAFLLMATVLALQDGRPLRQLGRKLARQSPMFFTVAFFRHAVLPWFGYHANPFRKYGTFNWVKYCQTCADSGMFLWSAFPIKGEASQACLGSWFWSFELRSFLLLMPVLCLYTRCRRAALLVAAATAVASLVASLQQDAEVSWPSTSFSYNIHSHAWGVLLSAAWRTPPRAIGALLRVLAEHRRSVLVLAAGVDTALSAHRAEVVSNLHLRLVWALYRVPFYVALMPWLCGPPGSAASAASAVGDSDSPQDELATNGRSGERGECSNGHVVVASALAACNAASVATTAAGLAAGVSSRDASVGGGPEAPFRTLARIISQSALCTNLTHNTAQILLINISFQNAITFSVVGMVTHQMMFLGLSVALGHCCHVLIEAPWRDVLIHAASWACS